MKKVTDSLTRISLGLHRFDCSRNYSGRSYSKQGLFFLAAGLSHRMVAAYILRETSEEVPCATLLS